MKIIRVRGVTNRFGDQVVHEDLDLDVRPGEFIAVLGGNGTGKTSLLRAMLGEQVERELAVARGVAVKDHLASRQLPEDRMFLGAPRTARSGDGWRPQAELQLAPR